MGKGVSYLVTLGSGVAIGLLLSNQCNPSEVHEVVIHDTIPGDSIPYTVYQDKPVVKYVERWHTDTFFDIDTLRVIVEHFTTNHYADTLKDDTSAFIAYSASVFRNEIQAFKLNFQNKRPTAINHIYPQKVNRLHLGGHVGLNAVGVELGYARKENTLRLGYSTQGVYLGFNRVLSSW